jgi:hypothetical protein
MVIMIDTQDPVTISVPKSILADVVRLSDELLDQMHELLERNTDGTLSTSERAELDRLVRIAQFGQIASLALQSAGKP